MDEKEWKKTSRLLKENGRYQLYRITCNVWKSLFKRTDDPFTIKDLIEYASRTNLTDIDVWLNAMNRYVKNVKHHLNFY